MINKKKWKKFEELVAQVQKSLSPLADVRTDQRIQGRTSKRYRQIDIAIHSQVAQIKLLTIIECKDYKRKVDVEAVEAFKSKLSDILANKGIMVSPKGFTKSAINVALDSNIELYTLADTRDHDWKRDITVPFYIKFIKLKSAEPMIQDLNGNQLFIENEIKLFNEKGEFVSYLQETIWDAWNDPNTNTEQPNVFLPLISDKQYYIYVDDSFVPIRIFSKLSIEINVYFKDIPIHMSGFENEIEGVMHFPGLYTTPFELNNVQENWKMLGDVNYKELTQEGFCALGMTLKSNIPEDDIQRVLPNKGVHRTR